MKKPAVDLARLRRYRLGRIREVMTRADVALCVLVNPISLRYAVDFREYAAFQSHIPTYYLFLPLSGPLVLHAQNVVISEFQAINNGTLVDEDDEQTDWIEVQNLEGDPVELRQELGSPAAVEHTTPTESVPPG